MKTFLALILVAAGVAHAQAPAPAIDREQLVRRLATVETLIERSSAGRQIESGGDARAKAHRERARETHRRAAAALQSGDNASASRLLAEASVAMFEGVRLAGADAVVAQKQRTDYEARLESAKSLAQAQRRIAAEKPGVAGAAETTKTVDALIAEAERLAAGGEVPKARESLDRAYLVAKAAIGSMRGGDTLVRSLAFASKEEEYRYELDRNDTHRMLLKLLASEPDKAARSAPAIARSGELRGDAEKRAAAGAFAEAVGLLEDSTKELVRAIRAAGIYIPG